MSNCKLLHFDKQIILLYFLFDKKLEMNQEYFTL